MPAVGRYTQPITGPLTGGQAQTIISGTVIATPALAQPAVSATGASPLTLTYGTGTTLGSTPVIAIGSENNVTYTITGVTLGGSGTGWASDASVLASGASQFAGADIWSLSGGAPAGQTTVVVSASVSTELMATAYEFVNLAALDGHTGGTSTSSPWTSGSVTTTQAAEVWIGAAGIRNSVTPNPTLVGPASPWVNTASLVGATLGGAMTGYQITTATGSAVYTGTVSGGTLAETAAAIATFKAASSTVGGNNTVQVGPQGLGTVWYPAQCTVSTTTGVTDGSTFNLYLGPANVPVVAGGAITLVGTLFPGGAGTLALAIPPMTPGQYLIGIWTGGHVGDLASMNIIGMQTALSP